MLECPDCRGTGQRRVFNAKAPTNLPDLSACPSCHGTGQLDDGPSAPERSRRGGSSSESAPPDQNTDPAAQQAPPQE